MAIKKFKPTSPGRRGMTSSTFEEITENKPLRSLVKPRKKHGGRNRSGRITVRHRGGGHRQKLRVVDFKRQKHTVPARVAAIEYDPVRTARLARLHYADGEKSYIIAPPHLRGGGTVSCGPTGEIQPRNCFANADISGDEADDGVSLKEIGPVFVLPPRIRHDECPLYLSVLDFDDRTVGTAAETRRHEILVGGDGYSHNLSLPVDFRGISSVGPPIDSGRSALCLMWTGMFAGFLGLHVPRI